MFPFSLMDTNDSDIPTEPWEASPGVEGFLLGFFFIGLAVALLMWAMARSLRRINHNAKVEAAEEARAKEEAAAQAAASQESGADSAETKVAGADGAEADDVAPEPATPEQSPK